MIPGLLIGALGGYAAARLATRRFRGGAGCHGRHHRGYGFGPRALWGALRRLDLTRAQRREIEEVVHRVRRSLGDLRFGARGSVEELVGTLAADDFDRARAEQAAARPGEMAAQVKSEIVDGLARIHAVLTPEQRARLRELLGEAPPTEERPSEGPYR
jgi:Spy/CpxP family protein refolding chaperone